MIWSKVTNGIFWNLMFWLTALSLWSSTVMLHAQFPEKFENLKVLPKDIARDELREMMRDFSTALGVGCGECHVSEQEGQQRRYDWASDDKDHKEIARVMMEMVAAINGNHLAKLGEEGHEGPRAQCVSCHQGQKEPHVLKEVLQAQAGSGPEDVIAEYSEWRSGQDKGLDYVQDQTLSSFAQQLAIAGGKPDDAVMILKANLESHPQSVGSYFALGEIYRLQRKSDLAKANFEKVLELDPNNRRAQGRLRQLSRAQQR